MAELYIFSPEEKLLTILSEDTGLVDTHYRIEVNSVPDTPFSFTVEADSENAKHVKEENIVVFRDHEGDWRMMVIRELDDNDSIDGPETTAICEPVFLAELNDHIVVDRRFNNTRVDVALNAALDGTRWIGVVEVDLGLASTNFYYLTSVEAIWNILSIWGGEVKDVIEFDIETNEITACKIRLIQRLGADTGQRFEIDHNITEISRTVLSYPKTALYGRGASLETEGGGHTRYIDFADVEWKKSNGDPVDKPLGQKWVGDPELLAKFGYENGTKHRFGIYKNHDIEDPAELLEVTWNNLQEVASKVEVNYRLSVDLFDDKVSLGDTAIAIDRYFARPIEVQARIIAIEYDLLDIEGTMVVEMGQFLNLGDDLYRDVAKLKEEVNKPPKKEPITNDSFPDIKPGIPVNVEAIGGFKTIQLYWDYDNAVYISHYEVYGSQVKGFIPDSQHLLWRGRVSSFSHEVNTDEVWYYRVRAVNTRGTPGDFSQQVRAATVRIISDDILFGEDIAAELRELSKTSQLLADGTIDLSMIGEDVTDAIESAKTSANDAVARANTATQQATNAINQAQTAFDEAQAALTTANNSTDIATTAKTIAYESANQATNALTRAQSAMDEAKKKADINSVYTKTEIDRALTGYASVTAVNTLTGRVDKAETAITQNANNIALKADKNVVDTLKNTVDNHSTLISQNADAIALKANQSTVDALTGRVSTAEATLTTQANQIAARITKTDADAKYATQTALTATANSLTSSITAVQTDLNNLQVGGRNLIKDSNNFTNLSRTVGAQYTCKTNVNVPEWGAADATEIHVTGGTGKVKLYKTIVSPSVKDCDYTLSVWCKNIGNYPVVITANTFGMVILANGESKRVFMSGKGNGISNFQLNIGTTADNINNPIDFVIWRAKGEKGNKATDWTPAPEDLVSTVQFSQLQQTVDSINGQVTKKVDKTIYDAFVQQTAQSLSSKVSQADYDSNNKLVNERFSSITQTVQGIQAQVQDNKGNISTVTQLANALQTRMSNAEGSISTLTQTASSLQSTISSVRNDLNNLDIGGRNLIRNSEIREVKPKNTGESGDNYNYARFYADMEIGQEYTISAKVEITHGSFSDLTVYPYPGGSQYIVPIKNGRIVRTFIKTSETIDSVLVYAGRAGATRGNGIILREIKLEKGNKATDWTPAPEDLATQSQFTQLADAINLRVQKGDVINQINLSTEGILIDGNKIRITGQTLIDNGVIKSAHIADAAITSAKIANLAVGTAAIADAAITSAKIANLAVGTAQIQDGAITNAKIANITADKINVSDLSAISANLGTVTAGNITGVYIKGSTIEGGVLKSSDTYSFDDPKYRNRTSITSGIVIVESIVPVYGYQKVTIGAGCLTCNTAESDTRVFTDYKHGLIQTSGSFEINTSRLDISPLGLGPSIKLTPGLTYTTIETKKLIVSSPNFNLTETGLTLNLSNGGFKIHVRGSQSAVWWDNNVVCGWSYWSSAWWRFNWNTKAFEATNYAGNAFMPITASGWNTSSKAEFKTDIKIWEESALEKIRNSTIYEYLLKEDESRTVRQGVVIGEGYQLDPEIIEENETIDQYRMNSWSWKAIQELDSEQQIIKDRLNWLEIENQYLKQKIQELEAKQNET